MKKPTIRSIGRLESINTTDQKLYTAVVLSFLGHLLFFFLFIFLPKITPESKMPLRVINVQLVSPSAVMPTPASTPQQKAPASEAPPAAAPKAATPKADVSAAPKPKEAVSLASKENEIETKQSMKKRTYKRERLLENAIKSVEKRVEESKTTPEQQALDQAESEAAVGAKALSGEGKPTSDIQRIYYAEVVYNIQRNWAFSEQLAGSEKNLYNEVVIKIQRSGTIEDIWFDRRSGNRYFDDSTYKAILKSSPLPPIPNGISGSSLTLGLRFIPEGLK